jgi:uncharacterized LabA/DUF88 family protein
MKKKKKTINFAFIDSQNLNLSIREQGWVIDFRKFRTYLHDKYKITKAFLFIGFVPEHKDMYTQLQKSGYILVFKPTLTLPSGKPKGNVDAELVLHAMIEYKNYVKALIVTGDGDFYCLVDYLAKNKKLLKLLIPNRSKFSSLYRKMMKHIVFMNDLKEKLHYKQRTQKKKRGITAGRNPLDNPSS